MKKYFVFCYTILFLLICGCSIDNYKVISGEVKSYNTEDILFDIPVGIDQIYVSQWEQIKLGDKLVKVDLSEVEEQITDNENQLKIENLELERLNQAYENIKNNLEIINKEKEVINKQIKVLNNRLELIDSNELLELKQILNNISAAENSYVKSEEELESNRVLFNSGAISKSQLKSYIDTVDKNKQTVEDLKISFESLKQNFTNETNQALLTYQEQLYSIEKSEADFDDAQILIQKEKILQIEAKIQSLKSKIESINMDQNIIVNNAVENASITEIYVNKGSNIASCQTILSITDIDALYIEAYLPEYYSEGIRIGTEVIIIPYADNSRQMTGTIKEISSIAVDRDGETVLPIKIEYKDSDKFLLPGFGVDVKIARKK